MSQCSCKSGIVQEDGSVKCEACNQQVCPPSPKRPDPKEIEEAHTEIARAYFQAVLELLHIQGHGEFNFIKKTVETPNGGVYLLQIQHVTGPKIDAQKLSELV